MKLKAKIFKSHKRKMANGTYEYFNIIKKPSVFSIRTLHKYSKKRG